MEHTPFYSGFAIRVISLNWMPYIERLNFLSSDLIFPSLVLFPLSLTRSRVHSTWSPSFSLCWMAGVYLVKPSYFAYSPIFKHLCVCCCVIFIVSDSFVVQTAFLVMQMRLLLLSARRSILFSTCVYVCLHHLTAGVCMTEISHSNT